MARPQLIRLYKPIAKSIPPSAILPFFPTSSRQTKRQFHQTHTHSSDAMPPRPRIAIVGGGPGGLTMAQLLQRHNIPFTIFELRDKPSEEELSNPSGMLDLHQESGILAIKECGLYDDFAPLTGECSQEFRVADRSGTVVHTHGQDEGDSRPEISRNNLTKLLLANIPSESIKWRHKLLSATKTTSSPPTTTLHFANPKRNEDPQTFDLVIGADGAWSKVRSSLLTKTMPHYTGMQIVTFTIPDITTTHPALSALIGTGTFSCLGNHHSVFTQRGALDSARIYLWLTMPEPSHTNNNKNILSPATPPSTAQQILLTDPSFLGTFGQPIKALVSAGFDAECDNPLDIRPLSSLPYGFSWDHQPGVTLIGDAAHLMLPNGEGVNAAMFDALELCRAVVQGWNGSETVEGFHEVFEPLLKELEERMVERGGEMGKETEVLIEKMFAGKDAAGDVVKFFQEMVAAGERV